MMRGVVALHPEERRAYARQYMAKRRKAKAKNARPAIFKERPSAAA